MARVILGGTLSQLAGGVTQIDLEARNQLLVRMTTQNLDEAIRARREGRKPSYAD